MNRVAVEGEGEGGHGEGGKREQEERRRREEEERARLDLCPVMLDLKPPLSCLSIITKVVTKKQKIGLKKKLIS